MTFGTSRREFIVGAGAFSALSALGVETPRMRIGVLADIHCSTYEKTETFRHALAYFDEQRCDGVVICGDLTNYGHIGELLAVGRAWDEIFPGDVRSDGGHVEKLFIYGDHDMGGYMHLREEEWNDPSQVIPLTDPAAAWKNAFHEDWEPIRVKTVNGYAFILASHPFHDEASEGGQRIPDLEQVLATRAPRGELPFFHVQHRVIRNTVGGPDGWGQEGGASRAALNGFPNAFAFCGHAHTECQDEQSIWQGEFTAVEAPSLCYLGLRRGRENSSEDTTPSKMMNAVNTGGGRQGLLMDVYDDRIVLVRRDFIYDCEVAEPWVVPLPAPGACPYDFETRAQATPAPQFAVGAAVSVVEKAAQDRAGVSHRAYQVRFPPAHATLTTPRAFDYEVEFQIRDAMGERTVAVKRVYSYNGHFPEDKDTADVLCVFAADALPMTAEAVRFLVRPVGCFERAGSALVSEWIGGSFAPSRPLAEVVSSSETIESWRLDPAFSAEVRIRSTPSKGLEVLIR